MSEKFGITPLTVNLKGTRGDDLYFTFDEFTNDGSAYVSGTTARLFAKDRETPANTITSVGTFDPDSETPANLKKLQFKIDAADNDVVTIYDYDIQITYVNADILTHVIGTLTIEGDIV